MKLLLLLFAFAALGQGALLGSKKCTYGPAYWCGHIHYAKECSAMQYCMNSVWNSPHNLGDSCADVVKVLDDVRRTSESELLSAMTLSCMVLPGEKHQLCEELLTHDVEEVLTLLRSELSSKNIAHALGLCGDKSNTEVMFPVVETQQAAGNFCADCLIFFKDAIQIFNQTEGEAIQLIKSEICSKLGPLEEMCNQTVDKYADFFNKFLIQQLNPEDWCYLLRLCRQDKADFLTSIQSVLAKMPAHSLKCDVCINVVGDLQNLLRTQDLQDLVLSGLENHVCHILPANLSETCKKNVAHYGPAAFAIVTAEMDPKSLCQTLTLCSAKNSELSVMPQRVQLSTISVKIPEHKSEVESLPQCALCEFVVKEVEDMVPVNATEHEIVKALEKVCAIMPKTLETDCDEFVEKYATKLAKFLAKMAPEAVCSALGLCALDEPVHVEPQMPVQDKSECEMCEAVVGHIKSLIDIYEKNEQIIEEMMLNFCASDLVPISYRAECKKIAMLVPEIASLLKQFDDPVKVCTELGMCQKSQLANLHRSEPQMPAQDKPECEMCEKVVGRIKSLIDIFGENEQMIENMILDFCESDLVPTDYRAECKKIAMLVPEIVSLLKQFDDPVKVCTELGMCQKNQLDKKTNQQTQSLHFLPMAELQRRQSCNHGPSVWCASMENAKFCNVVELCVGLYGLKADV